MQGLGFSYDRRSAGFGDRDKSGKWSTRSAFRPTTICSGTLLLTQPVGRLSHSRNSLARKRWHDSRVIWTVCLPSLIPHGGEPVGRALLQQTRDDRSSSSRTRIKPPSEVTLLLPTMDPHFDAVYIQHYPSR